MRRLTIGHAALNDLNVAQRSTYEGMPLRVRAPGRITVGALLTITLAACNSETLSAPAPVPRADVVTAPPLPPLAPSVVDAPISYALAPAIDALETVVPKHFGDINRQIDVPKNSRQKFAYEATRTPFVVAFDGKQVTLVSTVSYQGRGWYKPMLSPTISSSCGTEGVQPRMRIVIAIDVDLTRDWRIATRSRLRSLRTETDTPRDQCRVTPFRIDVTERVLNALQPVMARQLPMVDRRIASIDVRTRMERWFNLLNKSIHVHDSLWLMLAPEQLRLGGFELEDRQLIANVRLIANPTLISGPRPPPRFTPLPPLERAVKTVGDSAHLRIEGFFPFDLANGVLTKELLGRKVARYNRSISIVGVNMYSLRDGRLALAVRVNGDINGDAFLVGTPKIDTLTRVITVPDLDFDVATANALVKGLAWLKKADFVTQLRDKAKLPIDPLLDASRAPVERALNRDLSRGIRLAGRVQTGRVLDLVVETDGIRVRAEATGVLALSIDREIPVGKAGANRSRRAEQKTPQK